MKPKDPIERLAERIVEDVRKEVRKGTYPTPGKLQEIIVRGIRASKLVTKPKREKKARVRSKTVLWLPRKKGPAYPVPELWHDGICWWMPDREWIRFPGHNGEKRDYHKSMKPVTGLALRAFVKKNGLPDGVKL